jgi:hypothetical protein
MVEQCKRLVGVVRAGQEWWWTWPWTAVNPVDALEKTLAIRGPISDKETGELKTWNWAGAVPPVVMGYRSVSRSEPPHPAQESFHGWGTCLRPEMIRQKGLEELQPPWCRQQKERSIVHEKQHESLNEPWKQTSQRKGKPGRRSGVSDQQSAPWQDASQDSWQSPPRTSSPERSTQS